MFSVFSRRTRFAARILVALALFCLPSVSRAQKLPHRLDTDTNQPPKAARSVQLVYDAAQADIYYAEMRIDQTTDNSFFVPISWQNGYFGLQQFNGEKKRALNFAVWTPQDLEDERAITNAVEIVYVNPSCVTKRLGGAGNGVQCMRQIDWRVGETNRLAVQAQTQGQKTAYTAWLFDEGTATWERLATFRATSDGRWLRGIFSFIEDFRRDYKSAQETRLARFGPVWLHQDQGTWLPLRQAMFTTSFLRTEAVNAVDASEKDGVFVLATGGNVHKSVKVGGSLRLSDVVPFKKPEPPNLWFLYNKPQL